MAKTSFGSSLKSLADESDAIFSSLHQINKFIYEIPSQIYSIHTEDPLGHIQEFRIIVTHLEYMMESLDQHARVVLHFREPFTLDDDPPSAINQALAIGYARMGYRLLHKARKNMGRLLRHAMNYLQQNKMNSLEQTSLFAKIYGRLIDTESFLNQGSFALRIAYNYAFSKSILKELLQNTLTINDLQAGDIILSYKTSPYLHHNLLSRLISIAEKTNITHSSLVYSADSSHIRVLAASGNAGRLGVYDLQPIRGEFWFVFRPDLAPNQQQSLHEAITRWANEFEIHPGKHRFAELKSWVAVLLGYLFAEIVLYSNTVIMIPNLAHSARDYFCSDIIDQIFKEIGIHLVPRSRYDGIVGPAEFFYSPYLNRIGIYSNKSDADAVTKEDWTI